MSKFWGRYCNLKIKFSDDQEITYNENMKITFRIMKRGSVNSSSAKITVYNPSIADADKVLIAKSGEAVIILDAGYKNNFGNIFTGSLMNGNYTKQGAVDMVMELYTRPSIKNENKTLINTTFNRGITNKDYIKQLALQFNWIKKVEIDENIATETFNYDKPVSGKVKDCLDAMKDQYDFDWYLEGYKFIALKTGTKGKNTVTHKINEENGLLGIPIKTDQGTTVKTFINHRIRFNDIIDVDCKYSTLSMGTLDRKYLTNKSANGQFYALKVTHVGDTRGNEWSTEVQGWRSKISK